VTEFYQRFRDPRVNYVMVVIGIETDKGTFGDAFHVRMTEEEYENFRASSRRQYERGYWPPGGDYRTPGGAASSRSYPSDPFSRPFYDSETPFYAPGSPYEQQRREYERERANMKAEEEARKQKEQQDRDRAQGKGGAKFTDRGGGNFEFTFKEGENFWATFGPGVFFIPEDEPPKEQFFYDGEPVTEEEFHRRNEKHQKKTAPKMSTSDAKKRLCELAEMPLTSDAKAAYKKAMRRCHPDMPTGSHELWLELAKIAMILGLGGTKAGRSAG